MIALAYLTVTLAPAAWLLHTMADARNVTRLTRGREPGARPFRAVP